MIFGCLITASCGEVWGRIPAVIVVSKEGQMMKLWPEFATSRVDNTYAEIYNEGGLKMVYNQENRRGDRILVTRLLFDKRKGKSKAARIPCEPSTMKSDKTIK